MPLQHFTDQEMLDWIQKLARERGTSLGEAAAMITALRMNDLVSLTDDLLHRRLGTILVPIHVVTVVTAGTPVQGPKTGLLLGFETTIRMRHHSTSTGRLGYVGFSEAQIRGGSLNRLELKSNDAVEVRVNDWQDLWFDSDTNTTYFELFAERETL